jgi:hypothetical protein
MTNKELQEYLNQFPEEAEILIETPIVSKENIFCGIEEFNFDKGNIVFYNGTIYITR